MNYHKGSATYVKHIQLRVANLERAVRFYQDSLGFKVLEQDQSRARLSADGQSTILSIVQPANVIPKQARRAGLYHFALLLPERSDLAQMVNHLARQGIRFGSANHLVSEAIYLEDPDGNGIEIYSDTDPATWIWNQAGVEMDTIPLDFDDLLKDVTGKGAAFELPAKTIIGHIHLHVSHLDEAETFYTDGLGFEIVTRFRDSTVFLSTSKYHHHIALNTWNGVGAPPTDSNSVGLDFFTLVFPDETFLDEAIARLKDLGAPFVGRDDRLFVSDPAGNHIKLGVQI